jgi:hypothetical protein
MTSLLRGVLSASPETYKHTYTHTTRLPGLSSPPPCSLSGTKHPLHPLFIMPTYVDLIDPEVFPMIAAARPRAAASSTCACNRVWVVVWVGECVRDA